MAALAMAQGKLVRDGIPEIIRQRGGEPVTRRVEGPALFNALVAKLLEEADELAVAAPDDRLEELADVFEVVRGLAEHVGLSLRDVQAAAEVKRNERGGFTNGVWLN